MKRFFNKFFNVFAILLAICLAASFVSCKNNDDDDDDSSGVTADSSDSSGVAGDSSTVYTYSDSDGNVIQTLTFYDDKTVTNVIVHEGQTHSSSGTWTGSLSGTGTITMNGETITFSVSGNTMTINNGNGGSNELTKQ